MIFCKKSFDMEPILLDTNTICNIFIAKPCLNLEPMSTLFSFFFLTAVAERTKKGKLLLTQIKRKEWNYWISEKCKPHLFLSQLSVKKCMCELVGFLHFSWATRLVAVGGRRKKNKRDFFAMSLLCNFLGETQQDQKLKVMEFQLYLINNRRMFNL